MNGEDDDEEIGAYIYQTSHTARLFREKAALEASLASSSSHQTQRKSARLLAIKSNSEQDIPTTFPDASTITSNGKRKRKLVLKEELCTTPVCLKSSRKPPNKGGRYSYTGGRKRRLCSFDGCTNIAHGGGVCRRHGATRSTCRYEGCIPTSPR